MGAVGIGFEFCDLAVKRWAALIVIALILNQEAGSVDQETDEALKSALTELNLEYQIFGDDNPARAAKRAIADGYRHLCACGGDGTVAAVANSILLSGESGLRMTIVPLGTGNIIATSLSIPSDLKEAIKLCTASKTRALDVGKVGNQYFLLGLGIGATERFVTQASNASKEKIGRLAYLINLIKGTRDPVFDFRVRTPDREAKGTAQAITLASLWGTDKIKLLEGTKDDDGTMESVVNHKLSIFTIVQMGVRGLLGSMRSSPDVEIIEGSEFAIDTKPSLPVQLDGNETDLLTPILVEVLPRAIAVTVPED